MTSDHWELVCPECGYSWDLWEFWDHLCILPAKPQPKID